MTSYVLGFMFSEDLKKVVLILKRKPEWQAGKLNGVGGKIEVDEFPIDALLREFREETGIYTTLSRWLGVAQLSGKAGTVFVYAMNSSRFQEVKSATEESVGIFNIENLHVLNVIPNLRWLIPLCLAYLTMSKTSTLVAPIKIIETEKH